MLGYFFASLHLLTPPVLHNVPSLQELQHSGVGRLKQLELLCSASSCPIRVDNQRHPSVCSLDLLFLGQAAWGNSKVAREDVIVLRDRISN